jgi:hypothetical protein
MLKVLKGNMLIGVCSSLETNSTDLIINRFGEIKKKEPDLDKYKLIRKSALTFQEGDIIGFKYITPRRALKIENETKKLECKLDAS